jgi:DNA-binding response OmpR family regulator/GGDEF domain-containing protein
MEINVSRLKEYGNLYKVLYVEDDKVIRDQTKNFLGRFFTHVDVAEDGSLGLDKYQNGSYDVVITDINMPKMNGIEMIEKIREINENQIVLVTSAHNDSENLLRLINLNIMRFVLKPFDFKKFLIVLYNIVSELYAKKQIKEMNQRLEASSQMSQSIVDSIDIGLVVLEKQELKMANEAFLKMYDFPDFDTLILEMPQIGVLFQNFSSGITAETNLEIIEEYRNSPEEEQRVRILQGSKVHEFQLKLSVINEEEQRYILSFTDVTELHHYLTQDFHTKLPHRQAILGYINSMATTESEVYCYCIKMSHFDSVLKWYGKEEAISLESEMAEKLKSVLQKKSDNDFLGYFEKNQFIILTQEDYAKTIEHEIEALNLEHNNKIDEENIIGQKAFRVEALVEQFSLDLNQPHGKIEATLMNRFDSLDMQVIILE